MNVLTKVLIVVPSRRPGNAPTAEPYWAARRGAGYARAASADAAKFGETDVCRKRRRDIPRSHPAHILIFHREILGIGVKII
jgi:hypothetical protein